MAPPAFQAPSELPVTAALPALGAALAAGASRLILQAPPGAGKTTIVPLWLLAGGALPPDGRILMLEPRRIAARAAAERMASLLGEPVGQTAGYRVRLDSRISAATRIEVMTEGLLSRRLQDSPDLAGVSAVLFDEVHERSLHLDLALAMTLEAQAALRPDLRLLAMSATPDTAALARVLGQDAPVIASEGRMFPVEVRHLPRDDGRPIEKKLLAQILASLEQDAGDLLVFLPGAGMIHRLAGDLAARSLPPGTLVLPLWSGVDEAGQRRALAPPGAGERKIVLATSIAETSVTIPGVRVVIDSGLTRRPVHDPATGISRLRTVAISRAAAEQRRGRAGRTAPGICHRLWLKAAEGALPLQDRPEILDSDLAPLLLDCALWGTRPEDLPFPDPPPAPALAEARKLLDRLGALEPGDRPTRFGRDLGRLPLHPRLAAMVLRARPLGLTRLACWIAALIEEGDPALPGAEGPAPADLRLRLSALLTERQGAGIGLDRRRAGSIREMAQALIRQSGDSRGGRIGEDDIDTATGLLLAFAWPDRIGVRREPGSLRYHLSGGTGASLAQQDRPLAESQILGIAELAGEGRDRAIRLAAPVALANILQAWPDLPRRQTALLWDESRGVVAAREELRLGAALVEARPAPLSEDRAAIARVLAEAVRGRGIPALRFSQAATQLRQRLETMAMLEPEGGWPQISDGRLLQDLEGWILPHLPERPGLAWLQGLDWLPLLQGELDWPQRQKLDRWLPTHLTVPTGSQIALDYADPERPVLAVRLQEIFGWTETPRLAEGRLPVLLHLLSPGYKPVQVTADLKSFWAQGYPQVRAELRGRYIRHSWPEDPTIAEAIRGPKKRGT